MVVPAGEPRIVILEEAKGAAMMTWSYGGISAGELVVLRIHFADGDEVEAILRIPVT